MPFNVLANEPTDCHETAVTQAEMNECAGSEIDKAQHELDKELANIKSRYADNPEKLEKIEKAQEAWKKYMEAQLDLLYFDHTGSVAPMCAANQAAYFINTRTKQLQGWIDDNAEYNVCGGL